MKLIKTSSILFFLKGLLKGDRKTRFKRNPSDIEEAYSKYYQRIKQKYQDFVKYLLGYNNGLYNSMDFRNPAKKFKVQNGRWYYANNDTDQLTRYKATHKSRTAINDFNLNEYDEIENKAHRTVGKIPMPNIYENSRYTSLRRNNEPIIYESNSYNYILDAPPSRNFKTSNETDFIEQLKAQIIRKKRSSSFPETDSDTADPYENKEGRKRLRGPCEDLVWDSFANITVVRPGKVPGRNSVGIILSLECNAGFKLNIKGENVTARCIRGIWKPETPKCISGKILMNYF